MSPVDRRGKSSRQTRSARAIASTHGQESQGWQHAAALLEAQVAAGRFEESGKLPTEVSLAKELGQTRHILRRAIAALVKKGILLHVPHVGTFIAPRRVTFTIGAKTRFSDALSQAGFKPGRRRLSCRECNPPPEIARALGVASRSRVVEIVQLLTANEMPVGYSMLWLPADRFARIPDLLQATGTLRRAMAQIGVPNYRRKAVTVTSRFADPAERRWIDLPTNSIVIGFEGVSVDEADEPTHAFHYHFDAGRVALLIEP